MNPKILDHYSQFSMYTNPGCYREKVAKELPDSPREMGHLVRRQAIHRVTLLNGNKWSNADLRYGDMTKVPWWRQCEDDNLPTAAAMLAELYRRDARGFVSDRSEEHKLIVTCRFVAILTASILKAKGIPARVRSGFESYATPKPGVSCDHWITQYWDTKAERWVTIDVDCCMEEITFNPFDLPADTFEWSADVWLNVREGKVDPERYWNAGGHAGLMPIAWELLYDFHCLMGSEIIYLHGPKHLNIGEFEKITEEELKELDDLARLMQKPDENFDALQEVWGSNRKLRLLTGALL
jgi:hypothetical protein